MSAFQAILLGLVQGLTEFLPISSSGHLTLFGNLLRVDDSGKVLFFVLLHVATLLSVVVYFFRDLIRLRVRDLVMLAIGTIPALIVGLFAKDLIESLFSMPAIVSVMLMVTGAINIAADKKIAHDLKKNDSEKPEKESFEAPGWKQSLLIGCAQAAAIIPGISRSGSTVAAGVFQDVPRRRAFTFSFMLSIPAILGAAVLELKDYFSQTSSLTLSTAELLGLGVAFLAGLLSLSLFSIVIKKAQLRWFGYYAILVGILTLFLFS